MIRINLLERQKAPKRAFQLGQKVPILCSLILLATALAIGWRFWSMRQEAARLDAEIVRAQQETARLTSVLQEVDRFEKRRAQLQQRVALIEELRKGQNGPVHLLDEVSRSVPDRLWLTTLKQDAGEVRIEGRTTSLTALSDFVGNLEASGFFARPVEILDSQVDPVNSGGAAAASGMTAPAVVQDLVRFAVKAQFVLPGAPAPSPVATTGATDGAASVR